MKIKILFILLIILLTFLCCKETGSKISLQNYEQSDSNDYKLTFLFEYEGIKIFRFVDTGRYRYFSIGKGSYLNQIQSEYNSATKTTEYWNDNVFQTGGK